MLFALLLNEISIYFHVFEQSKRYFIVFIQCWAIKRNIRSIMIITNLAEMKI